MDGQMQRGPADYPNDFFGFTNYTEVLHDHNLDVDSNIFSEAHSPEAEANEQTIIPYVSNADLVHSVCVIRCALHSQRQH